METLAVMVAPIQPSTQAVTAATGISGGEENDQPHKQSFGQVMADQTAPANEDTSAQQQSSTQTSVTAGAGSTENSPAARSTDETDATRSPDPDDAGRIAAAAALVQWLSAAPQPVASAAAAALPVAASPAGSAAGSTAVRNELTSEADLVDVPRLAAVTTALSSAADTQDQDPGTLPQGQAGQTPDSQGNTMTGSLAFQSVFGQSSSLTPSAQMASIVPNMSPNSLESPVGSHAWAEELGTRLAVMTARGEQTGSLKLSPEHLGPLEVQIKVQDDKASVIFGAQHADTRAALNEALPRLRELFATSGLQLTDAGVSRDGARQAPPPRSSRGLFSAANESGSAVESPVAVSGLRHVGMIDAIA